MSVIQPKNVDTNKFWTPQVGPQLEAVLCPADEIFMGGTRGGGKSATAVGRQIIGALKYGHAWNGGIIRMKYKEHAVVRQFFDQIIRTKHLPAKRVGGDEQLTYYRFSNGAVVTLHACPDVKSLGDFYGQQYCVGKGTPILMADKSYKNVEDVESGDHVLTLSGPGLVTRRMPKRMAECVKVETPSGSQICPTTHPILSACGWQSYASILDRYSRSTAHNGLIYDTPPSVYFPIRLYKHTRNQDVHRQPESKLSDISCRCDLQLTGLAEDLKFLSPEQRRIFEPFLQSEGRTVSSVACDGIVRESSCPGITLNSLYDCLSYLYFRDGLPRNLSEIDPRTLPLPIYAASPYLSYCKPDVQGSIPLCTLGDVSRYVHPYDGAVREAIEESIFGACRISYVGEFEVYDLTVDKFNHYISKCQVINKNTELCLDEAPLCPFIGIAMDMLKGCLRSPYGVPCHLFLTGNPGGPGSSVIKEMSIPEIDGGNCPVPEGQVNYIKYTLPDGRSFVRTRVFIRSRLQDNKYLYENNPGYIMGLMAIKNVALRTAWLDGRWDVFVGQAFNFNERHVIKPVWPIPQEVPVYMTFDWGFGAPFSVGWWWVDADDRIYRFAEWYGCDPNNITQGLRLTDRQIAEGIVEREKQMGIGNRMITRLSGPDCFSKKPDYKGGGQGPPTAEEFERYGNSIGYNLTLYPGDPDKKLKIRQFRNRLELPSNPDELPMLVVYDTCKKFINIIKDLCVDELTMEYLEDGQPLHPFDEACHICMARPKGADYTELKTEAEKKERDTKIAQLDNISQMVSAHIKEVHKQIERQEDYDDVFFG